MEEDEESSDIEAVGIPRRKKPRTQAVTQPSSWAKAWTAKAAAGPSWAKAWSAKAAAGARPPAVPPSPPAVRPPPPVVVMPDPVSGCGSCALCAVMTPNHSKYMWELAKIQAKFQLAQRIIDYGKQIMDEGSREFDELYEAKHGVARRDDPAAP